MLILLKNAYLHNNYGLVYFEQGNYFAAVKEFKMAISPELYERLMEKNSF